MRRFAALLVATLLLGGAAVSMAAPKGAATEADGLRTLLDQFLAGASVNDAAMHDRFWADDLIYTGSGGRRIGKTELMNDVRSAPAPKPDDPKVTYGSEDVRIQQYGTSALVAFRLVATTTSAESTHVARYLNSGFFVKRAGRWQAVGWQATRMP